MCDLDGNDLLNRSEFTWFNQRTSGEDVLDEEWTVVEGSLTSRTWKIGGERTDTWSLIYHNFY